MINIRKANCLCFAIRLAGQIVAQTDRMMYFLIIMLELQKTLLYNIKGFSKYDKKNLTAAWELSSINLRQYLPPDISPSDDTKVCNKGVPL